MTIEVRGIHERNLKIEYHPFSFFNWIELFNERSDFTQKIKFYKFVNLIECWPDFSFPLSVAIGFQSKVWRNSSSEYFRTWAASRWSWKFFLKIYFMVFILTITITVSITILRITYKAKLNSYYLKYYFSG